MSRISPRTRADSSDASLANGAIESAAPFAERCCKMHGCDAAACFIRRGAAAGRTSTVAHTFAVPPFLEARVQYIYKGAHMKINECLCILVMAAVTAFGVSCEKSGVQAARDEGSAPHTAGKNSLSMDDRNFLVNAEKAEVRQRSLARVALEKAGNNDVRDYAKQLADDSTQSLSDLVRLMNEKGVRQPPELSAVQLEAAERLHRLSGRALDHEFVSLLAADEQQVVAQFRAASETAEDSDVRSYAGTVLPSLRADLDKAADLEKKLARRQ